MPEQTHISIDNCGFNIASICKMTETEFIAQYTDQRQHGVSEVAWLQWMQDAYKAIIAVGKKEPGIKSNKNSNSDKSAKAETPKGGKENVPVKTIG